MAAFPVGAQAERVLGSDIRVWYSIGVIDEHHEIDRETLLRVAQEAEAMWERASGTNLFQYTTKAPFKINLVYGPMTEREEQRTEAYLGLHQSNMTVQAWERKRDQSAASFDRKVEAYDQRREQWQKELDAYGEEVATYNRKGGAPPKAYHRLREQREELNSRAAALAAEADGLDRERDELGELNDSLNAAIAEYNRQVVAYNKVFGKPRSMDQGVYFGRGIDIYYFRDLDQLRITLAHEFGHALGIGHLDDHPGALMHPLLSAENGSLLDVTMVDAEAMREVLRKEPQGWQGLHAKPPE